MTESSDVLTALWFSTKEPTETELADIESRGFELLRFEDMKQLAMSDIRRGDLDSIITGISWCINIGQASAIFGEFPAPILMHSATTLKRAGAAGIPLPENYVALYSAWRTKKLAENGKVMLHHESWCRVGVLVPSS